MAKISTPFAQLPDRTDPYWPGIYETIYAQLAAMGLPVPGRPYNEVTRAQLEDHLQKQAGKLIKAELKKTAKPNYSGLTDDEKWTKLHAHSDETIDPPGICTCLAGLPYAPNAIDIADVTNSQKNGD